MKALPESIRMRPASLADAGTLARTAEALFRETFAATNDPAQMDLYCQTHYSEAVQAAELSEPGVQVLLFESGDDVIGFTHVHLARPVSELKRLYVKAEWHGKGLAQQLMEQVLEAARAHGAERIRLGVWQENPRAMAFYRKFGFEVTGEEPFVLGTEVQNDYVMERAL